MEQITFIKCTSDNTVHESKKKAVTHLDRIYGSKMCAVSTALINLGLTVQGAGWKRRAIEEWIDSNYTLFDELKAIKTDMETLDDEQE